MAVVENFFETNHHEIASIITEPVMCNKGCILPKERYLEGLRKLCDQYGIALIFDEVITGFRLDLGGAQTYFDVIPDLSIFAKAIASGYPLNVIAGKKEWMELVEDGTVIHAGAMNSGNGPVAAALATLTIFKKELCKTGQLQLILKQWVGHQYLEVHGCLYNHYSIISLMAIPSMYFWRIFQEYLKSKLLRS